METWRYCDIDRYRDIEVLKHLDTGMLISLYFVMLVYWDILIEILRYCYRDIETLYTLCPTLIFHPKIKILTRNFQDMILGVYQVHP